MPVDFYINEFILAARVLQEKNMLNIGFGSISLKTGTDTMIINKKDTCIKEENFYIQVNINNKTLAYKESNEDVDIHSKIYKEISYAKTILNIFLPDIVAYSIMHQKFNPMDAHGRKYFNNIKIIEDYNNEKNLNKLLETLKKDEITIIKAQSIFIISRDIKEALKKAFILNNSAKILLKIPH
ncbi:L-fuculose-phosphate aldolase [Lebetimonas natsushimae]|uniref:L-fuculose-phosphate aldolase n=1 Tax=Lebetimonas natsushimae TaxID=1936991 RepID=A0A292YHD5_9BACT|nr:class II aldolase/adducin family protein [Lebetimonas natsushimae]GAX88144.1 L-fuculose-phosphate aldolase [Lebetimonas natsushimae]